MSDFLRTFAPKLADYSPEQCAQLLTFVDQHLQLNVDDVENGAVRINNALTEPNRKMWTLFNDNRRQAVSELEELKELLVAKIGKQS